MHKNTIKGSTELLSEIIDPNKMLENIEKSKAAVKSFLETKSKKISTCQSNTSQNLSDFVNPDKMLENIEEKQAHVRSFLKGKPKKIPLIEY